MLWCCFDDLSDKHTKLLLDIDSYNLLAADAKTELLISPTRGLHFSQFHTARNLYNIIILNTAPGEVYQFRSWNEFTACDSLSLTSSGVYSSKCNSSKVRFSVAKQQN